MAIRAKRLLVEEYESNDADFSLKLMEKTTSLAALVIPWAFREENMPPI